MAAGFPRASHSGESTRRKLHFMTQDSHYHRRHMGFSGSSSLSPTHTAVKGKQTPPQKGRNTEGFVETHFITKPNIIFNKPFRSQKLRIFDLTEVIVDSELLASGFLLCSLPSGVLNILVRGPGMYSLHCS